MSRILQIATGQQPLNALYRGGAPIPVLLWALVEEADKTTHLVGVVMSPETKQVVRADTFDEFHGYSP
ncbi:MAG: hypothetical protein DWQ31_03480 [Planctomycetota bacterium]|nr:MAG: hypothetical protein DWQ31_03480 [Planctomycetota bacterium]REJ90899.1 MAG: hypothetical protein DWQ35_15555 [Planctomycetota bacterium]REK17676.1 MAG: hypothetical protein DWQ42_21770 [Planctomycetota bacterium]REK46729.1 MAG: hypothetical protein DWQ46_05880 [Planctomycetota bacterium]